MVIDEAAHVEGLDELWTGLYPTLSTGGRCIALSTPNGVGNWFHQTYVDSEEGNNDFKHTCLPWQVHPDRDDAWFDKETRNMSRRQIAQELECNFNMSGETVIHTEDIEKMSKTVCSPEHKAGFDRNYYIWEDFDPTQSYLLVADVARGDGKDYSAFQVINVTQMTQAAEYQGKVDLDTYAMFLADVGKTYGGCLLVVENNNVGYAVLTKLEEAGYPNIYYSVKATHEFVDSSSARSNNRAILGFTTSMKTRPLIIAKLEEFIRNDLITITSNRLYNELKTFVWNNGKPEAMRGYNDDLVMSMAIACWVRDTALVSNQRDADYKKALLAGMKTSRTRLNTTIPGMVNYEKPNGIQQMKEIMTNFPGLFKG